MSFSSRSWWAGLLRDSFGVGFWGFAAFAGLSGLACYVLLGAETFGVAVEEDLDLLLRAVPRIVAALGVAGLVWVMLPRDRLMRLIGSGSGLRGLAIAAAAGIVTPADRPRRSRCWRLSAAPAPIAACWSPISPAGRCSGCSASWSGTCRSWVRNSR